MRWRFMLVLILGITVTLGQDFDDDEDAVTVAEDSESQDSDSNDEQKILNYESPTAEPGKFYFADHFDDYKNFLNKWIISEAKKDDTAEEIAKYDGEWKVQPPEKQILRDDLGLVLKSKAKHAAIASRLTKPFAFNDRSLIVQYEVTMQDGQECGGSYIKLLSDGPETADLIQFNDKTPYTIMFGPDKCGNDIKLHFIFRHANPVNGSITEKHCRKPKERLEEPFKDKLPHLYQLVVNPDNTFQISVDRRVINEGSLLTDFNPPVNPPKEIDDPEDKKPKNWDEREKIPDPDSKKPEDWDEDAPPQVPDPNAVRPDGWLDEEEEMIPDPTATKPEDWDTEMDGEWEAPLVKNPICEKAVGCGLWKAPLISNPDYKGKWRAPLIENPNYQGKWAPRKVPNPDYFEDLNPFKMTTISAIGIELWSMSSNILFDNLLITDDLDLADQWAAQTFDLKRRHIDKESESFFSKIVKVANENPWLWGVYILIIGVPLTFVLYMVCSSKDKPSAKSKKTDKLTPDDEPPNNTVENSNGEDEILDEDTRKNASPKSKKSDLEVNNDDVNEEAGADVDVEEIDSEETEEQIPSSSTAEIPAPSSITTTTTATADGARKRKPRKE